MTHEAVVTLRQNGEDTVYSGGLLETTIRSQLDVLKRYRDDGRVPSQHLLDDIACYEFIIENSLYRDYFDWKGTFPDHDLPKNYEYPAFQRSRK